MRRQEFEQRYITTQMVRYIFPLLHTPLSPPPPALPHASPPPPLAPDAPKPPISPGSSVFSQEVLLKDDSKDSRSIHISEDLPAQPEPIEINFDKEDDSRG